MFRGIGPLVMAIAIALCPAALDVCRVLCTGQAGAVDAAAAGHQHHAATPATPAMDHHAHHASPQATVEIAAAAVRVLAHGCVHDDGLPEFVGPHVQIALAPAIAPTLFEFPLLPSRSAHLADADPPDLSQRIALTTQLRV